MEDFFRSRGSTDSGYHSGNARYLDSSLLESTNYLLASQPLTIEEWNASLDPFRQAYPGQPVLFPFTQKSASSDIRDYVMRFIDPNLRDDLRKESINLYSWTIVKTIPRGQPA